MLKLRKVENAIGCNCERLKCQRLKLHRLKFPGTIHLIWQVELVPRKSEKIRRRVRRSGANEKADRNPTTDTQTSSARTTRTTEGERETTATDKATTSNRDVKTAYGTTNNTTDYSV